MDLKTLARLLVRFYALTTLFVGGLYATYLEQYYRAYSTLHADRVVNEAAASNFAWAIARVGAHVLFAFVLFARTDKVIEFLIGRDRSPPQSSF
jgi:hypothetical protein